ncbi:30S ribosomal protein S2 [uncultured Alistipes sp.]|jgi:ribosomal protein S2, bacterial type|uniref:30S ribosomal protein S2 n=2 Tax=uncultured Alistipes sp. TaxID=538949 RepID=UPI0025E6214B|nr:30S ribosomal protein S2 [uncultured Alistipes sp.]
MSRTDFNTLLEAGAHFGHLKRKWNPKMAPYIFMEKNGIHIIDLHKTVLKIDEAAAAIKQIAKSGRRVLFVATKKQAKDVVAEKVAAVGMPYVTERWAGGMLTNFPTIRKAVKKMATIDKMNSDGTFDNFSKREKLQISRQRAKLEKNLGSIADLTRLPAALFVVDVQKESNAVREAKRLSIPVFAMVDTCCDPTDIDYVIPANDDATKSIGLIVDVMCAAIAEGSEERKLEKEKEAQEAEAGGADAPVRKEGKPRIKKAVKASVDAEEARVAEVVAAVETPYEEPAAIEPVAAVALEQAVVVADEAPEAAAEDAPAVVAEEIAEAKAE